MRFNIGCVFFMAFILSPSYMVFCAEVTEEIIEVDADQIPPGAEIVPDSIPTLNVSDQTVDPVNIVADPQPQQQVAVTRAKSVAKSRGKKRGIPTKTFTRGKPVASKGTVVTAKGRPVMTKGKKVKVKIRKSRAGTVQAKGILFEARTGPVVPYKPAQKPVTPVAQVPASTQVQPVTVTGSTMPITPNVSIMPASPVTPSETITAAPQTALPQVTTEAAPGAASSPEGQPVGGDGEYSE